jgi:hypothetical protein
MVKLLLFLSLMSYLSFAVNAKPVISFFNEMKSPQLAALYSDTTLLPTLQKLGAEIRMGMMDLTPERANYAKTFAEGEKTEKNHVRYFFHAI